MSILIKGMEMPENCMDCPFACVGLEFYYCQCPTMNDMAYTFDRAETIPEDCPLVEVKDMPRDSNGRFSSGLAEDWVQIESLENEIMEA